MKIPVKTIKEVNIPDIITMKYSHFQDMINYLRTLEFIGSSTQFSDFDSFISHEQGGSNTVDLDMINVLLKECNRIVVKVSWLGCRSDAESAYIIFKIPQSF